MVLPLTSNELLIVVSLFNFVNPETYNELLIVVFFSIVDPETFNEPLIVEVFNCVNPEILHVDKMVALFDIELYELISYTPELFIIFFIIY